MPVDKEKIEEKTRKLRTKAQRSKASGEEVVLYFMEKQFWKDMSFA